MLNLQRIRAVSLDLDDTLWPIWPTIERAEQVLHVWLAIHAPRTAALFSSPEALREIRVSMGQERPELKHDLSALRRESIRLALCRAGDDPHLAEPAFEVFFAERQKVTLFPDVLPALEFLAARYPLVSLSNGNADLARVGLAPFFVGSIAASALGVAKPDARIFRAAACTAGVSTHEVLHVGDDVLLDVLGARHVGMQAVWVNRTQALWPDVDPPDLEVASLSQLCDALR